MKIFPRASARRWPILLSILLLPLLPTGLRAQQGVEESAPGTTVPRAARDDDARHEDDAPRVTAVRTDGPIRVDGVLDEASWAAAPPMTHFTQIDPDEGEPATEPTDVRFVYDDDALYVGAMLYDDGTILTRLARRDAGLPDTDFFVVYLDSYHDHQTAYRFGTNPSAMQRDEIVSGQSFFGDTSWDPVWEVRTQVTDRGWSVEMRIPFSQLRFSRADRQEWGVQVERKIRRSGEDDLFAFTPKLERGGVARYGHLEGIEGIQPRGRLELLPYVGGRAEYVQVPYSSAAGFADPYRSGRDYFGSMGLDLKYRVSSNLTLNATVNPDFGQVEVDPAVINLSAFETRYQERRPFFVEGADIFDFGVGGPAGSTGRPPQLLYSRRIGRAPQGSVPGAAVYDDTPGVTSILGAAKLTGRTQQGWNVGLLEAVTQREKASWVDADGVSHTSVVEPGTNYLVGRLRRDLQAGRTRIGVLGGAVNRSLADPTLKSELHRAAYEGGLDFSHEWDNRAWRVSGALAGSWVGGSPEAILDTQRSSARYFQRPDASYLTLDPSARSLGGYYAMADLTKQAGAYRVRAAFAGVSPGYEVNDLGFETRADRLILDTTFSYEQTVPGSVLRSWQIRGGPDGMWNYGGNRIYAEFNAFGNWQLLNYWEGSWRIAYDPEVDDDQLTRGGPLARGPAAWSGSFSLRSDPRKRYAGRAQASWRHDASGAWRTDVGLNATMRYRDSWEFSLGPRLSRRHETAQYVTSVTDSLAVATFGSRYVFAPLDQTTLSLETRVNLTLTPTLSFELYAQPFLSTGSYGALEEFRAPGTFDFLRYGADVGTTAEGSDGLVHVDPDGPGPAPSFEVSDPDFSYRSLLGNAVLRWEWRPGSTLYLVWQQSRSDRYEPSDPAVSGSVPGRFDLGRDTRALFGARPNNIFMVKVDYWLNP